MLSQHAYGNFVMQSDSHVTAVAHLFRLSSARCAYVYKGGAASYLLGLDGLRGKTPTSSLLGE